MSETSKTIALIITQFVAQFAATEYGSWKQRKMSAAAPKPEANHPQLRTTAKSGARAGFFSLWGETLLLFLINGYSLIDALRAKSGLVSERLITLQLATSVGGLFWALTMSLLTRLADLVGSQLEIIKDHNNMLAASNETIKRVAEAVGTVLEQTNAMCTSVMESLDAGVVDPITARRIRNAIARFLS